MKKTGRTGWLVLILCAVAIKIFSSYPASVERYYSHGFYPYISGVQRLLFGWIPFSIGDVLYTLAGVYLLYSLIVFIRGLMRRKQVGGLLLAAGRKTVFTALLVYVVFNALWGLNYNRLPMMQQMGMEAEQYSTDNLRTILRVLIVKLNGFDQKFQADREALRKKTYLFTEVRAAYQQVQISYPALAYRLPSVKPSIFSYAGNYLGFTGYYNPFTGEAQTNTTVPTFLQPFTTCHEIGHQLGFAKENEANFAGFLSARASANRSFQYSVYFDMYTYALRELYAQDSVAAKQVRELASLTVKADIITLRNFYSRYQTPVEPFIRDLYAKYLRANQQPSGLGSYNEVVAMLLGYYKRYGHI